MDYLTSGNSCINEGTSLVAWGAFLVSLGWFLVGKYRAINRELSRVQFFRKILIHEIIEILIFAGICAFIIIGLKNVGEGGALTTKGWNLQHVHSQKQNLIRAVAQEWLLNNIQMKRPPFTGLPYDEVSGKFHIYSILRTNVLNGVLVSGLWTYGDPNGRRFLMTVANYERAIITANQLFPLLNEELTKAGNKEQIIAMAKKYQNQVQQSSWYDNLKKQHLNISKLIFTEHWEVAVEQLEPNARKSLLEYKESQTQKNPNSHDKH
jgi:hypothetical protein